MLTEHLARTGDVPPTPTPQDFSSQLSSYMAKLGAKGGKVSGARRMKNLSAKKRQEIAKKAALARWGKKGPARS
jgi:hypothetical protein